MELLTVEDGATFMKLLVELKNGIYNLGLYEHIYAPAKPLQASDQKSYSGWT
jgi:hypothetical protein